MQAGLAGRLVVLAAIVLIAGSALCFLHTDGAAVGLDLCTPSWATAIASFLVIGLPFTGRSSLARISVHQLFPPDLPAPPPES